MPSLKSYVVTKGSGQTEPLPRSKPLIIQVPSETVVEHGIFENENFMLRDVISRHFVSRDHLAVKIGPNASRYLPPSLIKYSHWGGTRIMKRNTSLLEETINSKITKNFLKLPRHAAEHI